MLLTLVDGTGRDDLHEACQPYIRELELYIKIIFNSMI